MADERPFMVDIERIKINYNFSKTALMLLLVLFSLGGVLAKIFGNIDMLIPVIAMGLLMSITGLILIPRLYNVQLDKLRAKKR